MGWCWSSEVVSNFQARRIMVSTICFPAYNLFRMIRPLSSPSSVASGFSLEHGIGAAIHVAASRRRHVPTPGHHTHSYSSEECFVVAVRVLCLPCLRVRPMVLTSRIATTFLIAASEFLLGRRSLGSGSTTFISIALFIFVYQRWQSTPTHVHISRRCEHGVRRKTPLQSSPLDSESLGTSKQSAFPSWYPERNSRSFRSE